MNDSVIVRCPICGAGTSVALAVGQMLRCEVCQTSFNAPIGETSEAPVDEAGRPNVRLQGKIQAKPQPTAPPPRQSHVGDTASPSELGSIPVDGVEEVPTGETVQMDLPQPEDAPIASQHVGMHREETDEGGATWSLVLTWVFCLLVIAGTVTATVILVRRLDLGGADAKGKSAAVPAAAEDVKWTDATRLSVRVSDISVRVTRVEYGDVLARDERNEVISSEGELYLKVFVEIRSRNREVVQYASWYGNVFPEPGKNAGPDDEGSTALLFDDQDNLLRMMTFDDVSSVQGHIKSGELERGQLLRDMIVFEVTPEILPEKVAYLLLELPGAAVGLKSVFRFKVPREMVKGWADEE